MPIHVHEAVERDPSESCEPPARHDDSDVHELRDDEFFLEPDEPTLELPSNAPPSAFPEVMSPQLPRWAAASRVLLDSLRSDEETTLELPPWAALVPGVSLDQGRASGADASAHAELARAVEQVRAREAYLGEVELALAAANGRVKGQAFRIAELEADLAALSAQPREACPRAAPLEESAESPPEPGPVALACEDLQKIHGIGPSFARRLATLGIETFDAIAGWTAADVRTIARALGIGPERIKRQAWIKQARALRPKPAGRVRSRSARSPKRKLRSA